MNQDRKLEEIVDMLGSTESIPCDAGTVSCAGLKYQLFADARAVKITDEENDPYLVFSAVLGEDGRYFARITYEDKTDTYAQETLKPNVLRLIRENPKYDGMIR